jgi:hypothetical protein
LTERLRKREKEIAQIYNRPMSIWQPENEPLHISHPGVDPEEWFDDEEEIEEGYA